MTCPCRSGDSCNLNGLMVTEVHVELYDEPGCGKLRAFADVVLNGVLKIRSIRIVETTEGRILVAMPNRTRLNGDKVDTTHPISPQARAWFDEHVLDAYVDKLRERAETLCNEAVLAEAS